MHNATDGVKTLFVTQLNRHATRPTRSRRVALIDAALPQQLFDPSGAL
jgi:hypothetical protein